MDFIQVSETSSAPSTQGPVPDGQSEARSQNEVIDKATDSKFLICWIYGINYVGFLKFYSLVLLFIYEFWIFCFSKL